MWIMQTVRAASSSPSVGSLVGVFIGAFMGMSTESGMLRGAGVGAVSGAVFSIEAVESCIEIWRSSESGKYSIIFVLDIISSLFSGRIVGEGQSSTAECRAEPGTIG
ncbi:hypothetical protein GUJ93_ZPchr0005g14255 [Zizania palustris]|uniref:NEP1-interacting protein 1 n=1 Tax=Zizania palustris TaxID=103762 RepID=A0A8J5SMG8_ZIZPA|nr:hypothetical protein GUJ93_ZPchr0005g14255 [Zizania palustris]